MNTTRIIFGWLLGMCVTWAQQAAFQERINLEAHDRPLREVLQIISDQTDASFVFEDGLVDGKQISCKVLDEPVEMVLKEVMKKAGLSYQILSRNSIVLFSNQDRIVNEIKALPVNRMIPPILQQKITPFYPPLAQDEGIEGSVELRFTITDSGHVNDVRVTESSGYKILDRAATAFAERLKFNPAKQGSVPVSILMSWVLDYQLIDREFMPLHYVQKIDALRHYLAAVPTEKESVLSEMLGIHSNFVNYYSDKPQINYNRYIQELVRPEVLTEWEALLNEWPLHFLVFQDFIKRYPEEQTTRDAKEYLFYYLAKEIKRIQEENLNADYGESRLNQFIKTVSQFLETEYPNEKNSWLKEVTVKTRFAKLK